MGAVVQAQAYVRHQGGGGSDPHLIRGSDGELYVVKFRGNPQENIPGGGRILSNELVATKVGRLIGAPCPETAVVLVDDEMIRSAGIRYPLGVPPGGPQFGSRYVSDASGATFQEPTPTHIGQFRNLDQVPRMVLLDSIVMNQDRKPAHIIFHGVPGAFRFWAVDYGHCFGVNASWTSLPQDLTNAPLVAHVLADRVTERASLDKAIELVEGSLTDSAIESVLSLLPAKEWGRDDSEVASMRCFLQRQRQGIRARVLSHLRQFPNLKGP